MATVKDLRTQAKARKIKGYSRMTKAQLMSVLGVSENSARPKGDARARATAKKSGVARTFAADRLATKLSGGDTDRHAEIKKDILKRVDRGLRQAQKAKGEPLTVEEKRKVAVKAIRDAAAAVRAGKSEEKPAKRKRTSNHDADPTRKLKLSDLDQMAEVKTIQAKQSEAKSHRPQPDPKTRLNITLGRTREIEISSEILARPEAKSALKRMQALQAKDQRSTSEVLEFDRLVDHVIARPMREKLLQPFSPEQKRAIVDALTLFTDAGTSNQAARYYTYIREADSGQFTTKKAQAPKYEQAAKALNEFVQSAPKYEGEIHRGLNFRFKSAAQNQADTLAFVEQAEKNGIRLDAMSSFSAHSDVASGFAIPTGQANKNASVMLRVKSNRSGVDISPFSKVFDETEVLVPKGTLYRVVGKRTGTGFESDNKKGVIYLDLEEVHKKSPIVLETQRL